MIQWYHEIPRLSRYFVKRVKRTEWSVKSEEWRVRSVECTDIPCHCESARKLVWQSPGTEYIVESGEYRVKSEKKRIQKHCECL